MHNISQLPYIKPKLQYMPAMLFLIITSILLSFSNETKYPEYTSVELLGKMEPSRNPAFVSIRQKYSGNKVIYLRAEAASAFEKMANEASLHGIHLMVLSGFRSYDYQLNTIWNRKWKKLEKDFPDEYERTKKILEFSAFPGTSRHHWGSDIDINSLENAYFETRQGKRVYSWLLNNAYRFGFCKPYDNKQTNGRTGYSEEKWHWSYLPIAQKMQSDYLIIIKPSDLSGPPGSKFTEKLNLLENYVSNKGISCL